MTERLAIDVKNVTVEVQGKKLLDGVSLDGAPGEKIAVLGASGSGKTTLLRVIAGLEHRLTSGSVHLDGKLATTPKQVLIPPSDRGLAMLFQDLALWPHMTVAQHLRFPLGSSKLSKELMEQRINETINNVGLTGRKRARPQELSGGEQQRLALARALISRPAHLLLDEPFSSLDPPLREEMIALVLSFHQQQSFTLLLVTHTPSEATALAQKVILLNNGQPTWTGPITDLPSKNFTPGSSTPS